MKIGNNGIEKIYMGDTEVEKIYLGDDLVYGGGGKDYSQEYLTFKITGDGNINWFGEQHSEAITYYSKDGGSTWNALSGITGISVVSGDTVLFKCTQNSFIHINFGESDAQFEVEGNIMSLVYGDDFVGETTLPDGIEFSFLFKMCTGLTSAEHLILPATTLVDNCYSSMFFYCKSLTTAPELPATTLAKYCYENMFFGCYSLNYIKCLATDISAGHCFEWVVNVPQTVGTFVKKAGVVWPTGDNGIPNGWTIIEV